MRFKLNITLHADELLENIIEYVAVQLSNKSVAISILEDVEKVYNVLEERAEAFPYCEDPFLAAKGIRKALLARHDYVILYRIDEDTVTVEGIFHELENYSSKL